ncbi:MAG: adenylyltransferase/cytidyltransferase family protein [Candidatus Kaelpia aquatica]|nr:adenylyltransferase/cytidyltransferase family protein [Candidatus Kaelpia aquatica]
MKNKVLSTTLLLKKIKSLKGDGKVIGFTNGCFDILHPGHVDFISKAKKHVDFLVLGLNSDSSVRAIKGKSRPINNQDSRAKVLSALEDVDHIVVFDEPTPYDIISLIKPDYLFKGADWRNKIVVGRDILRGYGGKVKLLSYLKGYSTTSILRKICRKNPTA